MNKLSARISTVLAAAALGACGGGSGGDSPPAGGGGTGGTPPAAIQIATTGIITGFGSVWVNGVRYDTSRASVYKDGDPATEDDLRIGQIVRVRGDVDDDRVNGRADRIDFDDNVEGPIESIDLANGVLVVLGQTVLVGSDTSFDDDFSPRSLAGLAVGDVVEVSGFVNSAGEILATRIEKDDDDGPYEVTGKVVDLDIAAKRFTIGGLRVDYSTAMLEDFPAGGPSEGDTVEVKGRQFSSDGALLASKVELESDNRGRSRDDDDDDHDIEIEGLITRFVDATDFDVAGRPVRTTSATRYEDGGVGDLAADVKVEVEGRYDADGVLVAEKIEFKRDNTVRIEGPVSAIDASGTITVLGVRVTTDPMTRFEDKTDDDDVDRFRTSDLRVGDWVEVRGYEEPAGSNDVRARRLERVDADDEVEVRGPFRNPQAPGFQVLSINVDTDAATEFEDDDDSISAAEFFDRAPGRIVEVDGTWDGVRLLADEAEIEGDDDRDFDDDRGDDRGNGT